METLKKYWYVVAGVVVYFMFFNKKKTTKRKRMTYGRMRQKMRSLNNQRRKLSYRMRNMRRR